MERFENPRYRLLREAGFWLKKQWLKLGAWHRFVIFFACMWAYIGISALPHKSEDEKWNDFFAEIGKKYPALKDAGSKTCPSAPLPQGVWRVTSTFDSRDYSYSPSGEQRKHEGLDLACPRGTLVRAAANGTVMFAGESQGCRGRELFIEQPGYVFTAYGHLARIADGIAEGSRVKAGDVIGTVGVSGCGAGPRLHFDVWDGMQRLDPLVVCPGLGGGQRKAGL